GGFTGGGFGETLPGRRPGSTLPVDGPDDFKAFGPADAPAGDRPGRAVDAFDRSRGDAGRAPAKESYRGAASPPPMFTPATSVPVPEVFAAPGPSHIDAPNPSPPAEEYLPPSYEPPTVTSSSGLLAAASASASALLDTGGSAWSGSVAPP